MNPARASFLTSPLWPVLVAMGYWCEWGRAEERSSENQAKTTNSHMDERTRAAVAAGSVAGIKNPFTVFALVKSGQEFSLWQGLAESPEQGISPAAKVPALLNLDAVEDGNVIRSGDEGLAFCEALVNAFKTSQEAFQKSATRKLTYANLFSEPDRHRGQVVHFEGRLKRLVRYDPPKSTKLDGVQDQYEGWMFDPDNYGANPVCVVFTHLPSGLEPGDKLNIQVAFDGYFFKRYRYKAGDGWRDAPLLIGHTVVLRQPARHSSDDDGTFSGLLMSSAWVLIIGTIIVGVALFWWFRRNDRVLQDRLAAANPPTFSEPPAGPESHSQEKEQTKERPWFES